MAHPLRRLLLASTALAFGLQAPAEADTAAADPLAPLQERIERLESLVERLERDAAVTREELGSATSLQKAAAAAEEARRTRASEVDQLLMQAAEIDLALMAGRRVDEALERLQDACRLLAVEAAEQSGRLEHDAAKAAEVTLASARQALASDDWLLARSLLAGAADALVQARIAITGNAQPSWLER